MEVMSRYQVLPGSNPLPWFSGCPIQLHTVRLVQDRLADRVLLQLLALNVTDQPIKSCSLHIVCRDAAGTMLQDYPSVLLKNIHASAHCTFRNNQNIPLASHTAYVDIVPERVFFCDGQVWNRPEFLQGQLLPPPTPVDPHDPHAAQMLQEAQEAGLSGQYYYEEHNDFWYCSCGQPNPIAAQSCGRCCALRQWLRTNMRHKTPLRRSAPRPEQPRSDLRPDLHNYFGRSPGQYQPMPHPPQAPKPPEQLVVDPHTGELITLEKYNELMRAMYYRKNEYQPDPVDLPKRSGSKVGLVVVIILLLLALAGVGIWLALPQTQYGRYQEAVSLMEAAQYEDAYALFSDLSGYRQADDNANFCLYGMAQTLYETGDYAAAAALYQQLPNYRNSAILAGDCQYRLALAAMDEGEYEDAVDYLELALGTDEDSEIYLTSLNECYYALGMAAEEYGDYATAMTWYERCGDYSDAMFRLEICQQMLTGYDDDEDDDWYTDYEDDEPDNTGVDTSGKSDEEMYAYVTTHRTREDRTTYAYLVELCQSSYRDSQSIYDSLYAWNVDMFFNTSSSDLTTHLVTATSDESLYIHYIVSGGPLDGELSMKYTYKKPNGASGEKVLSGTCKAGSTGNIFWRGGIYADNEEVKAGTMTVSYYDATTGQLLATESIAITLPASSGDSGDSVASDGTSSSIS